MQNQSVKRVALAPVALLFCLILPAVAQAQDRYESDGAGAADSGDHIAIGIGGAVLPDFPGSEDYSVLPIPVVDIEQGPFFLNLGEGLGLNVIDTPGFRAGVSVVPMAGYDDDEVPVGIGELDFGAGARGFVSGALGRMTGMLAVTIPFAGDAEGMFVDGEVGYPVPLSDRLVMVPSLGATWADEDYLGRYFGVNAEQSAASGLPVYRPSSGFQDVSATFIA